MGFNHKNQNRQDANKHQTAPQQGAQTPAKLADANPRQGNAQGMGKQQAHGADRHNAGAPMTKDAHRRGASRNH